MTKISCKAAGLYMSDLNVEKNWDYLFIFWLGKQFGRKEKGRKKIEVNQEEEEADSKNMEWI